MASYYLDTSALIKRYVTETGSTWLEQLCAENEIFIGEITRVVRAYDAVQLALAVHANNLLQQENLSLIFVTSDKTLLQAAQAEGLNVDDPQSHADLDRSSAAVP